MPGSLPRAPVDAPRRARRSRHRTRRFRPAGLLPVTAPVASTTKAILNPHTAAPSSNGGNRSTIRAPLRESQDLGSSAGFILQAGSHRRLLVSMADDQRPPRLVTKDEVAEMLRCSPNQITRERLAGRLGFIKVGGRYFYAEDQVAAYVAANRVEPRSPKQAPKPQVPMTSAPTAMPLAGGSGAPVGRRGVWNMEATAAARIGRCLACPSRFAPGLDSAHHLAADVSPDDAHRFVADKFFVLE